MRLLERLVEAGKLRPPGPSWVYWVYRGGPERCLHHTDLSAGYISHDPALLSHLALPCLQDVGSLWGYYTTWDTTGQLQADPGITVTCLQDGPCTTEAGVSCSFPFSYSGTLYFKGQCVNIEEMTISPGFLIFTIYYNILQKRLYFTFCTMFIDTYENLPVHN